MPLGSALAALHRFEEAEPLLIGALGTFEATFGVDHERANAARERLAELYDVTGRADRAAELRARD